MHEIIGFLAAILTTFSFLPQVIKTLRTGDTRSLSLPMYVCFVLGVALWATYGVLRSDLPVILANGITLVLASIILAAKVRNG
ncbi:hypothetical protein GC173_03950 [bacterium]|nr:hypothetical protein [bacterium]